MIVDTARTAAELLAPHLEGREGPAIAVLHLDSERLLLDTSAGDHSGDDLPVRDIVAAALRIGSDSVIVGLGRPAGDSAPSDQERAAARRLADAAAAVGVRLTDHFIFAGGECTSFRALGLL